MQKALLKDVFQATLGELRIWLLADSFARPEAKLYAEVLKHYLSAEIKELELLINRIDKRSHIYELAMMRLFILKSQRSKPWTEAVDIISKSDNIWAGEAAFIMANAYFRIGKNRQAIPYFRTAYEKLQLIGSDKKALKSLMNIVACESRIDPSRMLFADFEIIANKAKHIEDKVVEGLCYQNISKEFQSLGAHTLALKYSHQAIECLAADIGTTHYYESLLQRCHVFIDLGRFDEAYLDFQKAKSGSHQSIKEALKCIENILGEKNQVRSTSVEPVWQAKLSILKENQVKTQLTETEVQLVQLIKVTPQDRELLIEALYGSEIDWESAKNRFKVMFARFKKKYPGLIISEEGKIKLNDISVLKKLDIA